MEEMENALGVESARGPEWKDGEGPSVGRTSEKDGVQEGSQEWLKELERAVGEVILIAKDRVRKLGLSSRARKSATCTESNPV